MTPKPIAPAWMACAVLLLWCGTSAAQDAPQGSDLSEKKQVFSEAVESRTGGNTESVGVQEQVDELSDQTDSLVAKFRTALKQVDSIRIYNDQMRDLIGSQQVELASLVDQLDRVDLVGRSVTPLMLRMIDAFERFVELDVPFLPEERQKRVDDLRGLMRRADVTNSEKYRQIMDAYQIENEYGRTIEAYRDTVDIDGRETTVDFLRFGRIALVYQSLDENESGVWDQTTRSWKKLDSNYRSSIRNGLRIARKQSAPDLIRLPLPTATDAGEST